MSLFDVTHGWKGHGAKRDAARPATTTEVTAYLREIAERRGIDVEGCRFNTAGIYRDTGDDTVCVLEMPGLNQEAATMETLDEDGNVIRSTPIAIAANGYMVMNATQVRKASGLCKVAKAKAPRKPVERIEPAPAIVAHEVAETRPAPAVAETAPIPAHDAGLAARVAALEATLARMGLAIAGEPVAANDDAPAAKRTDAQARAIMRAWRMRREMRERADLDRRALLLANGDNRLLHNSVLAAEGRAIQAEAQAANARAAATDYKREADSMEALARESEATAENSARRAFRMVRAAWSYRTKWKRALQDVRAARAEARALGRRLEEARAAAIPQAPKPQPGNAIANAFAEALS